jgi:alpha-galactosidase
VTTFRRTLVALVAALTGLLGLATVSSAAAPVAAEDTGLALTPPMGFNNWNATGCAVDEKLITDMADLFVTSGLKAAGYQYVNVDDCWADAERDPATGRLRAHPVRFPHGVKWLADYIHGKGLKFGIYTSAGTMTCAKTMPGGLDHEEVDAQTFADWGVDYLKYDNCNNAGRPYLERYTKMRDALRKTGRPIVFSICEWGENKPWEWGNGVGQLWRTTGDINDTWPKLVEILKKNAPLAPFAGPGHWNDPDMLEVGNGGMSGAEYRSHFNLWAVMAAPLLIGADLRKVKQADFDILLNREVIAVDQDRLGVQGTVLSNQDGRWVFAKPLANGDKAVVLFNETDESQRIGTTAEALGLPRRGGYSLRDLWQHKDFQTAGAISAAVPPHASVMYRVRSGGHDWLRQEPALDTALELPSAVTGVPGGITPAGVPFEATVKAVNHARVPVFDASVRLTAPPGWRVEPLARGHRLVLGTEESVTGRWRITPPANAVPGDFRVSGALDARWRGRLSRPVEATVLVPVAPPTGTVDLSDVTFAQERGGYGPVERNMSNGSWKGGDGKPLSIGGVKYAKGLGGHAPTQLILYLGGKCTAFSSDVGVDDERDERMAGSASFEVWADGVKAADSGVRTWRDGPVTVSAGVTGARFLRLVITDGGDGVSYDRGDFAGAKVTC